MTKRSLASDLRADLVRWQDQSQVLDPSEFSLSKALKILYRYRAPRVMVLLRLGQAAQRNNLRGLPSFFAKRIMKKYGCELPMSPHAIGPGFYMPHPVGVVLAPARLGENVSVIHGITIGMGADRKFPVIEDEVFLGAGCRIIGGITVGRGAKVGANAVVVKDVPPGASVGGVPARILGS